MTVLYVVSDQEGAGKTALCVTLARMLVRREVKAAVFKPVASTGAGADSDRDAEIYLKLLNQRAEGWPLDLPEEGVTQGLLEESSAALARVADGADVVLAEGSSRLSPDDSNRVAETLDSKVLVIAQHHRDLAAPRLKHWQGLLGDRLLGFVINGVARYLGTDARTRLLPAMEAEGLASFGVIPEDRRLLGVSVRQIAEHLEGRFIVCEERADALVEHLMVGTFGMDPGDLYFGLRDNKAVIVRGDRPDVQMPALSTPTACMVLTKGIEPIEYVRYEAEQEEVSVLVVQTDTLSTMDALNSLMARARFDHPLKLDRFTELVEGHLDLEALFSAIGLQSLNG